MPFRGLHYRSRTAYEFLTKLKLGRDVESRFQIASQFIQSGNTILDLCAGTGLLKHYLPEGCHYQAVDASPAFIDKMKSMGIDCRLHDLTHGMPEVKKADVLIMIISLCHFRFKQVHALLDDFKSAADRVVIVEDVLETRNTESLIRQYLMNYLCDAPYTQPTQLYTTIEFERLMSQCGYQHFRESARYSVGLFQNL